MKQWNISKLMEKVEDKANTASILVEVISKVFFAWIVLNIRKVFARE